MAITGAHVMLYTREPEALRAILRDVFDFPHVDAGNGWLIFALPPAELGVHPLEGADAPVVGHHQLTLTCDDIKATVHNLREKGIAIPGEPEDQGWGITVMLNLPGVQVMLYQPHHPVAATFAGAEDL